MIFYFIAYAVMMSILFYWVDGKWAIKTVSIALFFYIAAAVWFSTDSFKGWPTRDILQPGIVLWVAMAEPTETDEGGIFLWMVNPRKLDGSSLLDKINPLTSFTYAGERAPRSYRIEYNENNANMAAAMKKALEEGQLVSIGNNEEPSGNPGDVEGKGKGGYLYQDDSRVEFDIINPVEELQK